MKNSINIHRRALRDLLSIKSHQDFHSYLISHAIDKYAAMCASKQKSLGTVLALCANDREAVVLEKYSFDKILLTGINEPNDMIRAIANTDPRISYQKQNSENISIPPRSYDLVMCKEGLHHLARPVLGLYEMLRIAKTAVVIIEPYDAILSRLLEILNLSSVYETNVSGNLNQRDNFVFRWSRRQLEFILNSYYIESGYSVDLTLGWMTSKLNANPLALTRRMAAVIGWLCSFLPGSRGNYMTALIGVGSNVPPDPIPL
jgi:hypothetical protein